MQPSSRSQHLARNTVLVAASFGLAAAAGLFRNIIVAQQFGIGAELDAYYAAFKLPDLLFAVVAGGALATAFIPVFAEALTTDGRPGAWRLASAITNLVVLVTLVFAVAAWLTAPWLVRTFVAPGFDAAQQAETAAVMRILLLSSILFAISSVQSSVLQGFKHFLLPALAPIVYPLSIAAGALWLAPTWGVRGLAVGAVVGAVLHLAVKIPGLIYYGFRWWPALDLRAPYVRRVLLLMGPRVLDLAVFQITLLVTTNLASRLSPGSVSAVEWGWDVMQLPETVIGTAFGLVALPTLAELAARHDAPGLRSTLGETLRAVMALTVPAAAALILLGRPALTLVYQRGSFDAAATEAVYVALRFFALGLVGHSCLELAARAFFAQQDTVTPLLVAMASGALNILLAVLLIGPLEHGGLALANSVAISVEVILLLLILRRRWRGVGGRVLLSTLGRVLAASAVMSVVMAVILAGAEQNGWGALPTLFITGIVGLATYCGVALLLHERSFAYLPAAMLGRRV